MSKLTIALALATGLTLGMNGPATAGSIIQTLETPELSASTFNALFQPIDAAPVLNSTYQFLGSPTTGNVGSQVFKGSGAAEGLYAYAYQLSVNNVNNAAGDPEHLDSVSYQFNATPVGSDFANVGHDVYAYSIKDGSIGSLVAPQASAGDQIRVPNTLAWQPGKVGVIRAAYVDPLTQTQPLGAGATSATFVLLSTQPFTQQFINLQGSNPTSGPYSSVYSATGGPINPVPVPEPSTLMAWAGMGAAALVARRVRKTRASR
ncbi:PEP-CTERM sorting domain-containing protein [Isosphaeraceae bacterium EP7]